MNSVNNIFKAKKIMPFCMGKIISQKYKIVLSNKKIKESLLLKSHLPALEVQLGLHYRETLKRVNFSKRLSLKLRFSSLFSSKSLI